MKSFIIYMSICFFFCIHMLSMCNLYILSTRPTCCIMVSMFLLWQMVFCTTQGGDWSSEAASHNWAAKLGGYRDLAKRWQEIVLFVFKCSSRWTWPGDLFFLWDPRRSERSPYVFVVSGTSPVVSQHFLGRDRDHKHTGIQSPSGKSFTIDSATDESMEPRNPSTLPTSHGHVCWDAKGILAFRVTGKAGLQLVGRGLDALPARFKTQGHIEIMLEWPGKRDNMQRWWNSTDTFTRLTKIVLVVKFDQYPDCSGRSTWQRQHHSMLASFLQQFGRINL